MNNVHAPTAIQHPRVPLVKLQAPDPSDFSTGAKVKRRCLAKCRILKRESHRHIAGTNRNTLGSTLPGEGRLFVWNPDGQLSRVLYYRSRWLKMVALAQVAGRRLFLESADSVMIGSMKVRRETEKLRGVTQRAAHRCGGFSYTKEPLLPYVLIWRHVHVPGLYHVIKLSYLHAANL